MWTIPPAGSVGGRRGEGRGVRIALVSGPDPGHLLPVAAVALALRRRGHRTTIVTAGRWRDDLTAAGHDHALLPRTDSHGGEGDFGWRMWDRASETAPVLADTLAELGAEVVIADTLATGGGFAADLLGLPRVEVTPHWLWEPSRALPPIGLGQRPARTPVGRALERYQRRQQRRSVEAGAAQRDAARARVDLPPDRGSAVLRLVGTVPALEPERPDWPERTHLVGALEWEPPSWPALDPPAGHEPLVVVTDSTASTSEAGLAERTVEGLRSERVRVVATTQAPIDPSARIAVGRGRHGPLLDRAGCAVGPGGGGFVARALTRGVPLVLVPEQGDQRETAARVERLGAGLAVAPASASPSTLREAVTEVLGSASYRRAAERAASTGDGLGAERAADLVELRVSVSPHRRP